MKIRIILSNMAVYSAISLAVVAAIYLVDWGILSSYVRLPPTDTLFIEGIIFLIVGLLFITGRGGISRASLGAAMLAAKAKAIYGKDIVSPNEIFRRDAWKSRGFTRTALILIFSGVLMILVYFLSL